MNIFNDRQMSVIAALTDNYWEALIGSKTPFLPDEVKSKMKELYFIDIISGLEDDGYWDELLDGVTGEDGVE